MIWLDADLIINISHNYPCPIRFFHFDRDLGFSIRDRLVVLASEMVFFFIELAQFIGPTIGP